jgi:hypothetical protein
LEKIARDIKNRHVSEKKVLKSLNQLMAETRLKQKGLMDQLEADLNPGGISETTGLERFQKGKLSVEKMRRLEKKLARMFDGQIPGTIQRDLANLDRNLSLEKFLSETMDDLMSVRPGEGKPSKEKEREAFALAADRGGREGDGASSQSKAASGTGKENAREDAGRGSSRGEPRHNTGPGPGGGPDMGEETIDGIGRDKAEGKRKSPYELKKKQSRLKKVKGIDGKGDRYKTYIRSLASMGAADLKEEEIIRPYERELETVLRREDIPMNYREYIKNYFLSIGIGKEGIEDERVN